MLACPGKVYEQSADSDARIIRVGASAQYLIRAVPGETRSHTPKTTSSTLLTQR
jgi:hypothetical protein